MEAESQNDTKNSRLNGRSKTNGRFLKGRIPWNKGLKGWQKNKPEHLFKKGHLPHTAKPLGVEKIDKDGFVRVKVSNESGESNRYNRWKLKHHVIWEKYHPDIEIGKDNRVIFLDGNKRNFDISNLELISRREQISLTKFGELKDADETRALISLIRLRCKLLDLGADRLYNYHKKWNDKNIERLRAIARETAKKRRLKKKETIENGRQNI